jgi:hypothetical protein
VSVWCTKQYSAQSLVRIEAARGVLSAKQRPMLGGQAFGWDRKAGGSSVLVAVSLALWGVDCDKPARPRRSGKPSSCERLAGSNSLAT